MRMRPCSAQPWRQSSTRRLLAEASWPDTTDCDRLDQAFDKLNSPRGHCVA